MDNIDNIKHARAWLQDTDEMFSARGKAPEMPIKSIPKLDAFLFGLHRREMTVIAGRTSNGKSVLSVQLAWDMAKQGRSVYFMSLEMAVPRIIERIFSNEYLIDNAELWRGAIKHNSKVAAQYAEFKERLSKTRLVLSDMIGRTAQDLGAIEKAFSNCPDVMIIDHLNEISGDQNKWVAIERYLGVIREMAVRRNVALVVCCQVNRASQTEGDRRPQLHQLKGASAIEEKADSVILLHLPSKYDPSASPNDLEIMVAKNRYGATGFGKVCIYPQFSRITDENNIFKDKNEALRHGEEWKG